MRHDVARVLYVYEPIVGKAMTQRQHEQDENEHGPRQCI